MYPKLWNRSMTKMNVTKCEPTWLTQVGRTAMVLMLWFLILLLCITESYKDTTETFWFLGL